MALTVRHDLKFNVPGIEHQLLQVHLPVAEAGHSLGLSGLIGSFQVFGPVHLAHTPSAASRGGLQQHGITHLARQFPGLLHTEQGAVGAGDHRHPGVLGQGAGGGLAAHPPDHVSGGANVFQPSLHAAVGEIRVLRQKSVARVDGVTAGDLCRRHQGVLVQVAVRRPGGPDAQGPGGQLSGQGALVGLVVDGHRLHIQFPAGPDDPQGDLPPVGDQNTLQHGLTPSGPGTGAGRSSRPRRP